MKKITLLAIATILLTGCGGGGDIDFSERKKFSTEESSYNMIKRCQNYSSVSQCNLENPRVE
ncbi:MAG TPA: hypothetical protein EYG89_03815 [Bacteroidia bacterium]|nr:hypothetical protein [Bacteroidia bacterium]